MAVVWLPNTSLPSPIAIAPVEGSPLYKGWTVPGTMPASSYLPNVSVLASAAANAFSAFSAADAASSISKVFPLALRAPFSIVTPPIVPPPAAVTLLPVKDTPPILPVVPWILFPCTTPDVTKPFVAVTVIACSSLTSLILCLFAFKSPSSGSTAWTENPIPAVSTKAANAATTLLPARLVVLFVQLWANSDVTTYWCFTLLQMTL